MRFHCRTHREHHLVAYGQLTYGRTLALRRHKLSSLPSSVSDSQPLTEYLPQTHRWDSRNERDSAAKPGRASPTLSVAAEKRYRTFSRRNLRPFAALHPLLTCLRMVFNQTSARNSLTQEEKGPARQAWRPRPSLGGPRAFVRNTLRASHLIGALSTKSLTDLPFLSIHPGVSPQ